MFTRIWFMVTAIMLWPMMVLAQATTLTPDQASELVKAIADAASSKNWSLLVGLAIMLLVAVARWIKLLDWIPTSAMKWVAGGLAMLSSMATHLATGNFDLVSMMVAAISTGVAAVGGWELILKPVMSKVRGDK